jgi:hypothetical protein
MGYDSLILLGLGCVGLFKFGFRNFWKHSVLVILLFGLWNRGHFLCVGSRVEKHYF